VNKGLNDVSLRLVFSLLGGGIHVEEEFGPCIHVNGLLSPIVNFVLDFTVKICSRLSLYLEIG
jgi:hypothetical protein